MAGKTHGAAQGSRWAWRCLWGVGTQTPGAEDSGAWAGDQGRDPGVWVIPRESLEGIELFWVGPREGPRCLWEGPRCLGWASKVWRWWRTQPLGHRERGAACADGRDPHGAAGGPAHPPRRCLRPLPRLRRRWPRGPLSPPPWRLQWHRRYRGGERWVLEGLGGGLGGLAAHEGALRAEYWGSLVSQQGWRGSRRAWGSWAGPQLVSLDCGMFLVEGDPQGALGVPCSWAVLGERSSGGVVLGGSGDLPHLAWSWGGLRASGLWRVGGSSGGGLMERSLRPLQGPRGGPWGSDGGAPGAGPRGASRSVPEGSPWGEGSPRGPWGCSVRGLTGSSWVVLEGVSWG